MDAPAAELRFELMDVWRGWEHVTTPDNCKVTFHLDGERRRVDASLALLCELYGHVHHEAECHLVGGSGSALELERFDGEVRLRVNYSWECWTTDEALRAELEGLLAEAFELHDRLSTREQAMSRREGQLAALSERVAERGVGYDVAALYERLAG